MMSMLRLLNSQNPKNHNNKKSDAKRNDLNFRLLHPIAIYLRRMQKVPQCTQKAENHMFVLRELASPPSWRFNTTTKRPLPPFLWWEVKRWFSMSLFSWWISLFLFVTSIQTWNGQNCFTFLISVPVLVLVLLLGQLFSFFSSPTTPSPTSPSLPGKKGSGVRGSGLPRPGHCGRPIPQRGHRHAQLGSVQSEQSFLSDGHIKENI